MYVHHLYNIRTPCVHHAYTIPTGYALPCFALAAPGLPEHEAEAFIELTRAFYAPVASDGSQRHFWCRKNAPTAVGGYILPANRAQHELSRLMRPLALEPSI